MTWGIRATSLAIKAASHLGGGLFIARSARKAVIRRSRNSNHLAHGEIMPKRIPHHSKTPFPRQSGKISAKRMPFWADDAKI